jgi:hypothetical protein
MAEALDPALKETARLIAEGTRDQYDDVNTKFMNGQIDGKEFAETSAKIRAEALKKLADATIGFVMKDAVKHIINKVLPEFATGGYSKPNIDLCRHGRSGNCAECNTEAIDRMNTRPGTITIEVKN